MTLAQRFAWAIALTDGVGDDTQREKELTAATQQTWAEFGTGETVTHVTCDTPSLAPEWAVARSNAMNRFLDSVPATEAALVPWGPDLRFPDRSGERFAVAFAAGTGDELTILAGMVTYHTGALAPARSSLVLCARRGPGQMLVFRAALNTEELEALCVRAVASAFLARERQGKSPYEGPEALIPRELHLQLPYAEALKEVVADYDRWNDPDAPIAPLLDTPDSGGLVALPQGMQPPSHWTELHEVVNRTSSRAKGWRLYSSRGRS